MTELSISAVTRPRGFDSPNRRQAALAPSASAAEATLVERAKRDPHAFAELYRRYYAPLAAHVHRRVGDQHTTDDLVAEVFLTVMRSLGRYRNRGVPFRAWLYRIATNTVNRWARRRRSRFSGCSVGLVTPSGVDTGCDRAAAAIEIERARAALLALPIRYQAVLALHYLEDLSVEETASVLGCRIGTVKSRLSRGRDALREKLKDGR